MKDPTHEPKIELPPDASAPWERRLIERLVLESQLERRRARRWGIFFKLLGALYLFALLWLLFPAEWTEKVIKSGEHTALVDIDGIIAPDMEASADKVAGGLQDAFEDPNTKGVILRINSPGGSPVQAGQINDEISRLKKKYPKVPVYAVVSDICASGGYYVAVAADQIYADKASIVGSIGVLMNGFGFEETLDKLGVERRLLTAGKHKGILDPFSPFPEDARRYVQGVLDGLHQQFIKVVREGRGERLKGGPEVFSGLFWSGQEGVELGLVDGLGSAGYVARELIGAEEVVDFTRKQDLWARLSERLGTGTAAALARLTGLGAAPLMR
jgi:protease IV